MPPTPEAGKPTRAQCIRAAGAVFAAALIRIERERLTAEAADNEASD